jgi:signal transduction histidine kinase
VADPFRRKSTRFPFYPTLRTRLMGLMLLTSLSLIAVLVVFYYQSEKALYNEFQRKTTQLSKAIQIGLEGSSGSNLADPASLQAYLSQLNTQGVREISVISSTDRILASTSPESVGKWITERRKDLIFKAELGEPVTGEGQVYNVIVPVVANGQTMGYIHLALTTEDFSVFLQTSAIRRSMAALAVLTMGSVVAFFLAGHYTRPIERVVAAAGQVAAGNLDQHLPVERRDEIGLLARSFNDMVTRLRDDRDLKNRLRTAEHQAGIGQFARNIAHEIRNPLNFISLSIDHMRDTYPPVDPAQEQKFSRLVGNIKGEIERISRFAQSFLEYGRPFELRRQRVEPAMVLEEVLQLISARAELQQIKVVQDYFGLPELGLDPDFFRTCLLNVVANACDAMPDGGTLTVRGEIQGFQVAFSFTDTGTGVPADQVERMFEPFFTTKEKGLGLGLALTHRIVEEHGGKTAFSSCLGQGSTVTLWFPLPEEQAA